MPEILNLKPELCFSVVRGGAFVDDAEQFAHLFVEEPLAWSIRLHPDAVDDELRDAAFAGAGDDLLRRARGLFDVNFFVLNVVLGQKTFGNVAIRAPVG